MGVRSVALDRLDVCARRPWSAGNAGVEVVICRPLGQNESHEDFGRPADPTPWPVPIGLNFESGYAPPSSISWSSVVTSMQPPMLRATGHRAGWALWARSIAARSASGDTFSS